ncbi:MAG TPA: hypothetical protein VGJ29_17090 [Vicinamibacterales bacterium]|jgi:hypothetical protein
MTTNRKHLTATCLAFFLGTSAARAQEVVAGSFDQLRLAARLGDTMTVTDASGATMTGKLAALSPSQLTLLVGKSRRDLLEQDVRAIARHGHVSLAQGARWGFAIGGGIGLLSGLSWSSSCSSCGSLAAVFAATYASLGAGLGVGIAAVTPTRPVIYSVNDEVRRRVAVSPIAAPGRRGASLSVAF